MTTCAPCNKLGECFPMVTRRKDCVRLGNMPDVFSYQTFCRGESTAERKKYGQATVH